MNKLEINLLSVEELQHQIHLYRCKYEKALADHKNYAIVKNIRERIKKLNENLQLMVSA